MSARDYDELVAEIKRRFPRERILIVRYGDHQPSVTRGLLSIPGANSTAREEDFPDAFVTFYAMTGHNYVVPPLPDFDLDISFLGTVMLEASGLPLPDAYRERKRLMTLCQGKYYRCERQDDVLAFHRRLIDSGLVERR